MDSHLKLFQPYIECAQELERRFGTPDKTPVLYLATDNVVFRRALNETFPGKVVYLPQPQHFTTAYNFAKDIDTGAIRAFQETAKEWCDCQFY